MRRILASKGYSGWNEDGEFIYRDNLIPGSHVFDLMKFLASSRKIKTSVKLAGWSLLKWTLADLKIPLSTIGNASVQREIAELKHSRETGKYQASSDEDIIQKKRRKARQLSYRRYRAVMIFLTRFKGRCCSCCSKDGYVWVC